MDIPRDAYKQFSMTGREIREEMNSETRLYEVLSPFEKGLFWVLKVRKTIKDSQPAWYRESGF